MTETKAAAVCCTLPDAALRRRTAEIEESIGRRITEVRELAGGYALRFDAEDEILQELGRFIAFERGCCAFLDFSLRLKAGDDAIWLELGGSGDAKDFLRPAIGRWSALAPLPAGAAGAEKTP